MATAGSSCFLELHGLQQAADRYVINANSLISAMPVAEAVFALDE